MNRWLVSTAITALLAVPLTARAQVMSHDTVRSNADTTTIIRSDSSKGYTNTQSRDTTYIGTRQNNYRDTTSYGATRSDTTYLTQQRRDTTYITTAYKEE